MGVDPHTRDSEPMPASPASDGWSVEQPRPADRGLVARLLEDVVAADPSVAPEVADGSVRPGSWLHRVRPAWAGVVVDASVGPRTVVGYASVVAEPASGHRLQDVLVAPVLADRGVEQVLLAAATVAVDELAGAPVADPVPGLDIAPATYPDARVERPRGRLALAGAAVVVAVGALGMLAVQVGVGPLGGVLPFLEPSGVDRAAEPDPVEAAASPVAADPQPVVVAGQPIQPQPVPVGPSTGAPTTGPSPSPGPTEPTDPGPSQPPAAPGVTSSLLDPVVATVVETVDGLTGGALSPVTGPVQDAGDWLTDTLDELLPLGGDQASDKMAP